MVRDPLGVLAADLRVAAEQRRVEDVQCELVLLGQREEPAGQLQHLVEVVDAVADELEEADLVDGHPQPLQELGLRFLRTGGVAEVEHREDVGHAGSLWLVW
ncbi:hypothetical protein Asp14428_74600 [Actinoplanes sp. NBRC 14428]|nr:hypothetical protein Asp14428_74600 [Actinoplanes sp. NBRC 14428]